MTTFGDLYTRCYDLLYRDKNYDDEARYVADLLREHANAPKSLLELGCGTGRYTQEFLRMGYAVHGVDLSPEMLNVARGRCGGQAEFAVADISRLALGKRFDAVVALFHVVDYLTSNEQLDGIFASAADHLVPGGVFIFDFWYGPAVLSDRPNVRVKRVEDDVISVVRISEPVLRPNENIVEVHFDNRILVRKTNEQLEQREIHRMRYLFLPEIDGWLTAHGFARVAAHRWMTRDSLGVDSWYGMVVARESRGA